MSWYARCKHRRQQGSSCRDARRFSGCSCGSCLQPAPAQRGGRPLVRWAPRRRPRSSGCGASAGGGRCRGASGGDLRRGSQGGRQAGAKFECRAGGRGPGGLGGRKLRGRPGAPGAGAGPWASASGALPPSVTRTGAADTVALTVTRSGGRLKPRARGPPSSGPLQRRWHHRPASKALRGNQQRRLAPQTCTEVPSGKGLFLRLRRCVWLQASAGDERSASSGPTQRRQREPQLHVHGAATAQRHLRSLASATLRPNTA